MEASRREGRLDKSGILIHFQENRPVVAPVETGRFREDGGMGMDRSRVRMVRLKEDADDGFVDADPAWLFSQVWEITRDAWSFAGKADVERRLQRDVVVLSRRKG